VGRGKVGPDCLSLSEEWVVKVGCLGEGQGHLPMIMMMAILHAQKPAQVSSSLGSSSCVLHLSP